MVNNENKSHPIDMIDQALVAAELAIDATIINLKELDNMLKDTPYYNIWRQKTKDIDKIKSNLGQIRHDLSNERDKIDAVVNKKFSKTDSQLRKEAKDLR